MENDRYKFRVCILETGERLPVYSLEWTSRGLYFQSPRIKDKNHVEVVQGYVKDGVAELEQCTGLSASKSYRGNKPEDLLIWEGDKVLFIYNNKQLEMVVEWDICNPCFVLNARDGIRLEYDFIKCDDAVVEIIGNVHEESSNGHD